MDVARVLYYDDLHVLSSFKFPRWKYIIEHPCWNSRGQKMTFLIRNEGTIDEKVSYYTLSKRTQYLKPAH